ncbi:MAG: hypothetical protein K2J84_03260 [Bacteroidaceae bacterium]|nr:hypothetical protein [Bacteroidaceae bacterium]
MNASVYLFSELNSFYIQYPDDHTASIFKKFLVNAKSATQIAIHRDGNLMYYSYIWKPKQTKYIGLCVVLNGLVIKDIGALFYLFENTISNLVNKGMLVHSDKMDRMGNPIINNDKLYQNQEEIELLAESLREGFNRFELYAESLPPVSFGILKDSQKDFAINDNQEEILKSSYTNGYTYIYGPQGFNPIKSNSNKPVMQDNDFEFDALKQEQPQTNTSSELYETNYSCMKRNFLIIGFGIIFIFIITLLCSIYNSSDENYYSSEDTYNYEEDYYDSEDTYDYEEDYYE